MAGSIDATCAGLLAKTDFSGDRIVFRVPSYQSLIKLQRFSLPNPSLLNRLLRFSEQQVFVKVGNRKEMELFPRPSWALKLASTQLRRLINSSG